MSHNTDLLSTNQRDVVEERVGDPECPVQMVVVVVVVVVVAAVQDDGSACVRHSTSKAGPHTHTVNVVGELSSEHSRQ